MTMMKKGHATSVSQVFAPTNTKTASQVKEDFSSQMPEDIVFDPDYVYSRVRAISARVNLNKDGFRREELLGTLPNWLDVPTVQKHSNLEPHNEKFGYNTFKNKNNHIDHANQPDRDHGSEEENNKHAPRGNILWSSYHENDWNDEIDLPVMGHVQTILGREPIYDPIAKMAGKDCYVELLIANPRKKYPVLCRAIEDGIITKVSMGAEVLGSMCSVCGNFAEAPYQYCNCIKYGRGMEHMVEPSSHLVSLGVLQPRDVVIAHEDNVGLQFFEESWILDVQADPTAIITELVKGEPGLPIGNIKAASGNRDYDSMLVDILNLESNMKENELEKVANLMKRSDENPKVNVSYENLPDDDIVTEDSESKSFDHNRPPSDQPGENQPSYPFPCSAKVSASEANPQYPMDTTIDIEVCQGCMYNKTDKIGTVDCGFPDIIRRGGSDPLPPGFSLEEEESGVESEEGSGFRTEDGEEIRMLPNTEHPPGNRFSAKRNEDFYRFKSELKQASVGYWVKEGDSAKHTVEISVPSRKVDFSPIEGREDIVSEVTDYMSDQFGNVEVTASEGTWIDDGENHRDDKTKIKSEVEDIEHAKEVISLLSIGMEFITDNKSIEYHIDGEPFYTTNPDYNDDKRDPDWNPQNEIEIIGFSTPADKQKVVDMLTDEFGGTGKQHLHDPDSDYSGDQVISYFDDEDLEKAFKIFDLLDKHEINTDELDVSINGNPIVG